MKIIALVDCNNFFVSCERLFNPNLIGKPVVILSNNDSVIVSLSDEAKKLGLKIEPFFKVKEFCRQNNVKILSGNHSLYSDISSRFITILNEFTENLDVYSIDEGFLDLSHIPSTRLELYLKDIKDKIWQDLGIPVSIGAAATKTLAKIAQNFARKNDTSNICALLSQEEVDKILSITDIKEIWGIGKSSAETLYSHNIKTALEFKATDSIPVKQYLKLRGHKIWSELRGISCFEVEQIHDAKQTISASKTFVKKENSLENLESIISQLASEAARKLRQQSSFCSAISVFIETSEYELNKKLVKRSIEYLPYPLSDTPSIIKAAKKILRNIYEKNQNFKKISIALLNLSEDQNLQLSILQNLQSKIKAQHQDGPAKNLQASLDSINKLFGKDSIFYLAQGLEPNIAKYLSPNYTKNWAELMVVK